ncbi:hypothetical protein MNV_700066 [Candidatus Methanoperedens nitroreducens]|uniref:Uncharacterized protein n=1 Tax=Candidatus Methanoperedens nitratireducens TaxID=1392998 RepID=A0A284VT08_9EURY|nr:hypothetical protein MNV_700066 [Candidatus Methanoperedens nitroreducens]
MIMVYTGLFTGLVAFYLVGAAASIILNKKTISAPVFRS